MAQCKDCTHFDKFSGVDTGQCFAFPPVFVIDRTHDVENQVFWKRPITHKNDQACSIFQQE
jgi:hypothetical protein